MSEDILIGFLYGLTLAPIAAGIALARYRKTLRLCANGGTPEKLGDEFFYIVPESEFVRVKNEALRGELMRELMQKPPLRKHVATPIPHA